MARRKFRRGRLQEIKAEASRKQAEIRATRHPPAHLRPGGRLTKPVAPVVLPPVAVIKDDRPPEYFDDKGKKTEFPTPCCYRPCDARFPLEIDDESAYIYREAKACGRSYACVWSWCLMLVFATIASAGIIAIGFLDEKLLHYQIVGIVLTSVFGIFLVIMFLLWICLLRRVKQVRRRYHAYHNREQVFNEEEGGLGNKEKSDKPVDKEPPKTPSYKDDVVLLDEE